MVTRDLLYFVQLHKGDISFARSSESKGPSLQLAKLTCDFNLTTSDPSVSSLSLFERRLAVRLSFSYL